MRAKVKKSQSLNPFHPEHHGLRNAIYSSEVFRAVVERERHRCDRNNHCFALAVFAMAGDAASTVLPAPFIDTLSQVVRCTDEVGWLDERRIGVMLPETHAPGAWRFGEKVRGAMASRNVAIGFQVFSYPSPALSSNEARDPRQMWFEGLIKPTEAPAPGAALAAFFHYQPGIAEAGMVSCPAGVAGITALLGPRHPIWKHAVDVLGATAALILLAPVMLLIAAAIRLQSPGPVFFLQKRIGHLGRPFLCWKFRTMHVGAGEQVHRSHLWALMAADAPLTKLDRQEDPRLIPVGRLLRLSGLDELPQLFNVLRGEMSLVGPRPCIPYEYERFLPWHRRRTDTRPGLTGLWQVSGKNRTTFTEMVRFDIAYVRHNSIGLDLLIALRTLPALVGQMRDGLAQRIDRRRVATLAGRVRAALRAVCRAAVRSPSGAAIFKTRA